MSRIARAGSRTFRALSVRNFRLYFIGQVISVSGTWMQTLAQSYLILFPLHGTGVDVAISVALQFVPILFFGAFGGLIADRLDKRKVLYATQAAAGVLALALWLLVVVHSVSLWQVYVISALLGVVNLFDNPARQAFVSEMVERDLLSNAVSLNSVLLQGARLIGPAVGGVLILTVGVATCFLVNALSYVAVIVALSRMRPSELYRNPGVARAKGQVREGLRYVWATPDLRSPLLSVAVVGLFAFNFTVTLPLLAKFTFHGGAGLYGAFMAAMGAGAVVGGLYTAFRSRPSALLLALIGVFFGAMILAVALAPTKLAAVLLLAPMGAGSICFIATNNANLQLRADPSMRGRVMSLNAIALLGSTPIGALLVGYVSDVGSPRVALLMGAAATLLASVPLFFLANRHRAERAALPMTRLDVAAGMEGRVMTLHADRRRAGSFGEVAEQYDRVRPEYPVELVDALLVGGPRTVLDVGCGTGISSRLFIARGCTVVGLEPDPRMAEVARRRGVQVESGTIEEWEAGARRFDLLTAGQSWHWVDPLQGAAKAAAVLHPGGRIGLFWNQAHPDPSIRPVLDAVYARHAPELSRRSVLLGRRDPSLYESGAQSLRATSAFSEVSVVVFGHDVDYALDEWLDLSVTHSDHRALPPDRLTGLLADLRREIERAGGRVPVHYEATLVTGVRH